MVKAEPASAAFRMNFLLDVRDADILIFLVHNRINEKSAETMRLKLISSLAGIRVLQTGSRPQSW